MGYLIFFAGVFVGLIMGIVLVAMLTMLREGREEKVSRTVYMGDHASVRRSEASNRKEEVA